MELRCCEIWKGVLGLYGQVGFGGELFYLDNIGYYPAQWARELKPILRGTGTVAEVFHWISAAIVQMLPYNSGTFCGYQLHSMAIKYPVCFFANKAIIFSALDKFPGIRYCSKAQKRDW